MPVKIKIDPNQCAAKVSGAWGKTLYALSAQVLNDCNQYCKVDQNTLISSSYAHSILRAGKLIWQTPYARRQYWAIKTSLTPGRTWKWCETAKRKYKADWQKIAEKGLRSNL